MNFISALTFTGVAKIVTKNIVDPFALENGSIMILAALIAVIAWNLITWYYGIPGSSSYALIGSIAGAAVSAAGFGILNYEGFLKILQSLIISLFPALAVGFIVRSIFRIIFKNANLTKTTRGFRMFQIVTASVQAYTHGTNDAQKAIGIITMALIAANYHTTTDPPTWVRVSAAIAMGLGTSVGGWKIIKTLVGKIMEIRPINEAAADLSSAGIIFAATNFGLPVSMLM